MTIGTPPLRVVILPPLAFWMLRLSSTSGSPFTGSGPVSWRNVAAETAFVRAVAALAGRAPSIRANASM